MKKFSLFIIFTALCAAISFAATPDESPKYHYTKVIIEGQGSAGVYINEDENIRDSIYTADTVVTIVAYSSYYDRFSHWELVEPVGNCSLTSENNLPTDLIAFVHSNDNCTIKAFFNRTYTVSVYYFDSDTSYASQKVYDLPDRSAHLSQKLLILKDDSSTFDIPSKEGYHLSHLKIDPSCNASISGNKMKVKPTSSCEVTAFLVPAPGWEIKAKEQYDLNAYEERANTFSHSYYDDEHYEIRYFYTLQDTSSWYYLSIATYINIELWDYGTDSTYSATPKLMVNQDSLGFSFGNHNYWIKGDGEKHYFVIRPGKNIDDFILLRAALFKVNTSTLITQTEDYGYANPADTNYYPYYKTIPITAYPYTGYKSTGWTLLSGAKNDLHTTADPATINMSVKSPKIRVQANFVVDTTVQPVLKINSINTGCIPKICANVEVTALEREGNIPKIADSNFTLFVDGNTTQFQLTPIGKGDTATYNLCFDIRDSIMDGDTYKIKVATNFANKNAADSTKWKEPTWDFALKINAITADNLPEICARTTLSIPEYKEDFLKLGGSNFTVALGGQDVPFKMHSEQSNYTLCFDAVDSLVNRNSHQIKVSASFAKLHAADSTEWDESMFLDADVKDSIAVSSDSIFSRSTNKFKVHVFTQNFADDIYNARKNIKVKLSCSTSGDTETATAKHQKGGLYSTGDIKKNEGKAKKNDGTLTCSRNDTFVAEYEDPAYGTKTRTKIHIGDTIENEYQFFTGDFSTNLDSIETFGTNFAFRVTAASPTMDKVDTIPVLLFTNKGDSLKVMAIETGKYTSKFKGHAAFSFVISPKDQHDTILSSPIDLNSKYNRTVIHAQVEADSTPIHSRDSLVVQYNFIPADTAEIYDRNRDGKADFVRIHFVKPVNNEAIGIDTVFWGPSNKAGRGVQEKNITMSEDGTWIEAALDKPFSYGVTFLDSNAWKYLVISRDVSSATQNISLTDKIGAVPTAAEKRPGKKNKDDLMKVDRAIPFDTLVVSFTKPIQETEKNAWKKAFNLSSDCNDQKKWQLPLKKEPQVISNGRIWRIIVPHEIDMNVGYCLSMNPNAKYTDSEGVAAGIGGVTITGDNGDNYLYNISATPAIAGIKGNRDKWVNPETHDWETVPDTLSCIRTETKQPYNANIIIYDNEGHVVTSFKTEFGKNGELEDPLYENKDIATRTGFIQWNQRSSEGRRVSTGIYIWKIRFTFNNGHKEERFIKSGIRRIR